MIDAGPGSDFIDVKVEHLPRGSGREWLQLHPVLPVKRQPVGAAALFGSAGSAEMVTVYL